MSTKHPVVPPTIVAQLENEARRRGNLGHTEIVTMLREHAVSVMRAKLALAESRKVKE